MIGVWSNAKYFKLGVTVSSGFGRGTPCNESLERGNLMQNSHKTPLLNGSGREMHDILFKKFHSEGRRQYDLHCQLSAVSLQAAIAEGGSEEEPLKPLDRHTINYKI